MVFEAYAAVDLREKGIVFAEADIDAGGEPTPALPDEDRSTGDDVAVMALDAERCELLSRPLRELPCPFL